MATKVFLNLPVKDLERSKAFFTGLGYTFNMQFTDEKAACLILGENIFAMLLVHEYFKTYTRKAICDSQTHTEVLIALDAPSKEALVKTIDMAVSLGGTLYAEPQDHGWMYQHSFADLDGHQWEYIYMDETLLPNME